MTTNSTILGKVIITLHDVCYDKEWGGDLTSVHPLF